MCEYSRASARMESGNSSIVSHSFQNRFLESVFAQQYSDRTQKTNNLNTVVKFGKITSSFRFAAAFHFSDSWVDYGGVSTHSGPQTIVRVQINTFLCVTPTRCGFFSNSDQISDIRTYVSMASVAAPKLPQQNSPSAALTFRSRELWLNFFWRCIWLSGLNVIGISE
jgi:hypothetical protein